MCATEKAAEQVERARQLVTMLDLLRDAGADDLVRTLSAEQAQLLYHEVVHAVGRAAQEWRSARGAQRTTLTHQDDDITRLNTDDHVGPGREP